ncbi:MAG: hypothetical protein EOT04_02960 [Candidatus Chaera renei]|uniref:Uncharacterized protein n=1 Tax=Candidatus Chaera renei TaxID=2506947 RepID=A0A4Q0AGB4_9BACT|nr:MAG: hypothetical protein EOT04_02960 [Candidatus Chaera renei]
MQISVPAPPPTPPQQPPAELPKTGPADIFGAGAAVSSITAAGYYWVQSRRNLINRLMNR